MGKKYMVSYSSDIDKSLKIGYHKTVNPTKQEWEDIVAFCVMLANPVDHGREDNVMRAKAVLNNFEKDKIWDYNKFADKMEKQDIGINLKFKKRIKKSR